jgi:hypothetical protein
MLSVSPTKKEFLQFMLLQLIYPTDIDFDRQNEFLKNVIKLGAKLLPPSEEHDRDIESSNTNTIKLTDVISIWLSKTNFAMALEYMKYGETSLWHKPFNISSTKNFPMRLKNIPALDAALGAVLDVFFLQSPAIDLLLRPEILNPPAGMFEVPKKQQQEKKTLQNLPRLRRLIKAMRRGFANTASFEDFMVNPRRPQDFLKFVKGCEEECDHYEWSSIRHLKILSAPSVTKSQGFSYLPGVLPTVYLPDGLEKIDIDKNNNNNNNNDDDNKIAITSALILVMEQGSLSDSVRAAYESIWKKMRDLVIDRFKSMKKIVSVTNQQPYQSENETSFFFSSDYYLKVISQKLLLSFKDENSLEYRLASKSKWIIVAGSSYFREYATGVRERVHPLDWASWSIRLVTTASTLTNPKGESPFKTSQDQSGNTFVTFLYATSGAFREAHTNQSTPSGKNTLSLKFFFDINESFAHAVDIHYVRPPIEQPRDIFTVPSLMESGILTKLKAPTKFDIANYYSTAFRPLWRNRGEGDAQTYSSLFIAYVQSEFAPIETIQSRVDLIFSIVVDIIDNLNDKDVIVSDEMFQKKLASTGDTLLKDLEKSFVFVMFSKKQPTSFNIDPPRMETHFNQMKWSGGKTGDVKLDCTVDFVASTENLYGDNGQERNVIITTSLGPKTTITDVVSVDLRSPVMTPTHLTFCQKQEPLNLFRSISQSCLPRQHIMAISPAMGSMLSLSGTDTISIKQNLYPDGYPPLWVTLMHNKEKDNPQSIVQLYQESVLPSGDKNNSWISQDIIFGSPLLLTFSIEREKPENVVTIPTEINPSSFAPSWMGELVSEIFNKRGNFVYRLSAIMCSKLDFSMTRISNDKWLINRIIRKRQSYLLSNITLGEILVAISTGGKWNVDHIKDIDLRVHATAVVYEMSTLREKVDIKSCIQ